MALSLKKLIPPHHEYLILDRKLCIIEMSVNPERFADSPEEVSVGKEACLGFPELVGLTEVLIDILDGQKTSFELRGINRSCLPSYHRYFDLYIRRYDDPPERWLILFMEETTDRFVLQQQLAQKDNETSLLVSALTNSKNYINRIITSMANALVVTTPSGIIKTVNQAAEDLFGYSSDELINQPISTIVTDEGFLRQINYLYLQVPNEIFQDIQVVCQTKTGEKLFIEFSFSVIQTELRGLYNFVYIGRDITRRKCIEADILKALQREKELREVKSCFISMISHEFRVPMTSILASTELLQSYSNNWPEEKKLKHYNRIKEAVRQTNELLEDVLLISKAESGKLKFKPQPLELKRFCSDLVEEINLSIGQNHKINYSYSGSCLNACMDRKFIRHILTNLLINAIKYSPQGSTIKFSCYCQQEEAVFEIEDQGIGIPLKDQSRLFESFHRASNVGSIPGTGLGLTIVKKFVDLHQGTITVKSQIGVGTTFNVSLPLNVQQSITLENKPLSIS